MNARIFRIWSFALATGPLLAACSPDASSAVEASDGAAQEGASGGRDSGGATSRDSSSDRSSSGDDSSVAGEDSGDAAKDSGSADGSGVLDSGECIRPPFQTTNQCSGIGQPGGPLIPSCSRFDANGKLKCPTIAGCNVVPDPSGKYCTGDGVKCGLSDCGHICKLPDWEPCYDVATGACLEGC